MTPRRILLVEDHPDHAELAGDLLRAAGYEVLHCPRGEEALGFAKRFAPHLVVMDINLPGMDGMAATRLLKCHEETAGTPVLALTAYAMLSEKDRILAAGCVDVVCKPMDLPVFLAAVARLVGPSPADSSPTPGPRGS